MSNVLHGDGSKNLLNASGDKTQVYGLSGNDTIISDNRGDVLLVGGSGDDALIVMGGDGTLSGGDGNDTFEFNFSADKKISATIEDFVPSDDKIVVKFDGDSIPQISRNTISGGDVVLSDGDGFFNVTLKSIRENDYFDGTLDENAWEVLRLTNIERENQNLSALTMSQGLTDGAQIRAEEITTLGVSGLLTDHTRIDGSSYSSVFDEVGKHYDNFGENLDGGASSPTEVIKEWMDSPAHRENILNGAYKKIGVGFNYDDPDPTHHRYYWTQLFADNLNSVETVSASELLTAQIEIDTIKQSITLTDNDDIYSSEIYGATIAALGGNDSISNSGNNSKISGGLGNDSISLGADFNVIEYAAGGGSDTISGFNETDTLKISGAEFTPATVGSDVIVAVGTDSITLTDAANLTALNIEGTRSKIYIGTENADSIENKIDGATILALGGNDSIDNYGSNAAIDVGTGNDAVYNGGENVTIKGGEGNDYISNEGSFATIDMGAGADIIDNWGNSYVSITGDTGSDLIYNDTGTFITIDGGEDSDQISNWGDNVTIDGGTGFDTINNFGANIFVNGNESDDRILNTGDKVTVAGGEGNDSIFSRIGANISIDGGAGNDSITNNSSNITIDSGAGNDTVSNWSNSATILGGEGNDSILSSIGANISIDGGAGLDSINNWSTSVTIDGGAGDDLINNQGSFVTIDSGDGNDSINNLSSNVSISGNAGSDSIYNVGGESVTINGDNGNDFIGNQIDAVIIFGGEGNDSITNLASDVTINGGLDNDRIFFDGDSKNILIEYAAGDGRDVITGFDETDTIKIDGGTYSTRQSGDDIIVGVGTGFIHLVNAAGLSHVNIIGEEGTPIATNNRLVILDGNYSVYANTLEGAVIWALGEKISLTNTASNVTAIGALGDDFIDNGGNNVIIDGNSGNDSISNTGNNSTISGSEGDDYIQNIYGVNVSISAGAGNDTIYNTISFATLTGDHGDDLLYNTASSVTLAGGSGNDSVYTEGENNSIFGGAGNDFVIVNNLNATVRAGEGNDSIALQSDYVLLKYAEGDGNDVVNGFNETDTLSIFGDYSAETIGNDVIVNVGASSIKLVTAASLATVNIVADLIAPEEDTLPGEINKLVTLTEGADNYRNTIAGATIQALGGNDYISNDEDDVSIDAGADNDYISNFGANSTIDGGAGNENIINSVSRVTILGGDGDDSILNGINSDSVAIEGNAGNDSISNLSANVTIDGGIGDDEIFNGDSGEFVKINGGAGNDSIGNSGANVTINLDGGDDTVNNFGAFVTLDVADGDDLINNRGTNVIIAAGAGNDSVWNNTGSASITVDGGDGDDFVYNSVGKNILINVGAGDDSVWNIDGDNVTIGGDAGNDFIHNENSNVTIEGGTGNDSIENSAASVSIDAGAGDDSININNSHVTISGGAGNDQISLFGGSQNNLIIYAAGDGNDTIWGLSENSSLQIGDGEDTYSTVVSGDDIVVNVGSGSIRLIGARDKPAHIIIGESGSSGGGSGGNGGGGNSGGGNGGGSSGGGNTGGNNSGGTSTDAGRGNSSASGNQSATGNGNHGGSNNGSSSGGNTVIVNNTPIYMPSTATTNSNSTTETSTTPTTPSTPVTIFDGSSYSGGNQVISNYVSGQKIIFNEIFTEALFDGNGNFLAGSSTGALAIENARDKVIVIDDVNGNSILKACEANNSAIIDGRTLDGFEILSGSAESDVIYAGNDGSQLFGNLGDDSLVGGNGADTFVGGKDFGTDLFFNAASNDTIRLSGTNFGDVAGIHSNENTIVVNFTNGNLIAVQSAENLSANFVFDDAVYQFNHATQSWTSSTSIMPTTSDDLIYNGGNQVISNYVSGEKIIFNEIFTEAYFDGNGNFLAGSSTGALAIENARDKVIVIDDANGNSILKACEAKNSATIDGRTLNGFEILSGSTGADLIYAGNDGSQLFGNLGDDILIGGNGADIFVGGKNFGADIFQNVATNDTVQISDATIDEIISAESSGNSLALTFDNGNVINIQSANSSTQFVFADGAAKKFNHATNSWT